VDLNRVFEEGHYRNCILIHFLSFDVGMNDNGQAQRQLPMSANPLFRGFRRYQAMNFENTNISNIINHCSPRDISHRKGFCNNNGRVAEEI